ncbi:MAG: hypothetical protein RLZZ541_633, partial [Pseudomonadota bacterium]
AVQLRFEHGSLHAVSQLLKGSAL